MVNNSWSIKEVHWNKMNASSDWEELVRFDRTCYPLEHCVTSSWYLEKLKSGYNSWTLRLRGEIVANIQLREHESGALYIPGIAILPRFQKLGIAALVLEELLKVSRGRNLTARIHEHNHATLNFARNIGFTYDHTQQDENGNWLWFNRKRDTAISWW